MIQYFNIDTQQTEIFVSSPPPARLKDYHEIMWIQDGKADFVVDGDAFHVVSNAFFILPKDRYHQFLPRQAIDGQVIRFSEDFLKDFPRALFSKFNDLSEVKITKEWNEGFDLLFRLFQLEYHANKQIHVMRHLLQTLIYKLEGVKRKQFSDSNGMTTNLDMFDLFQILLDQHITKQHGVAFYADQLHVTPRKLGNTCKSVLNNTTEQVISQRLLTEAKRRLNYTDQTIAQIAYDIGFQDNSYFTKFFKKLTNLTPKQYRESRAFTE